MSSKRHDEEKDARTYSGVVGRKRPQPNYQHNRPRSIFIRGPDGIDFEMIWNALLENETAREYRKAIEGLLPLRKGTWILTIRSDNEHTNCRDDLYRKLVNENLETGDGPLQFELPRPPATHIIIKGIPTESTKQSVIRDLNKCGFGTVTNTTRVFRRNTNIYNGWTNAWIEDFNRDSMPYYISIDGYICQVKTADEIFRRKCYNCNAPDHIMRDCTKEKVCTICKKSGHIAYQCKDQETPAQESDNLQTPITEKTISAPTQTDSSRAINNWFDTIKNQEENQSEERPVSKTGTTDSTIPNKEILQKDQERDAPKPRGQIRIKKLSDSTNKKTTIFREDIYANDVEELVKKYQSIMEPQNSSQREGDAENDDVDQHNETCIDEDSIIDYKRLRESASSGEGDRHEKRLKTSKANPPTN